jgi:ABC-type nitrate/sulfonate/bicarbonate transport system substrate-binding protein
MQFLRFNYLTLTRKRNLIAIAVIILVIAIVLSSFVYLSLQNSYSGQMENVSAGLFTSSAAPSLVYVAERQNFFAQNGINFTSKPIPTVPLSFQAILNNDVNIGLSPEYSFVSDIAMQGKNLTIIASISKVPSFFITARIDRGIENPTDLADKRIGLAIQSASEYYLGRFLQSQGMDLQNVTLVNLKTTEYVQAIVNGTVDAVVSSVRAVVDQIQTQLGNNTVVWSAENNQPAFLLLVCRSDWATQHPDTIVRFLKSLSTAEEYIISNPASAQVIVEKYINQTITQKSWSDYRFSLTLDQSLIVAMQNEARWLINNNLTNATQIPDFLNNIYLDGLKSVKPEAVNIID